MILPIIYPSAVFYWRDKKGLNKIVKGLSDPDKCRTLPEHYKLPAREVISSYLQYEMNMKTPLSLMSPNDASRIHAQKVCCSVRPKHLPENSFIDLGRFQKNHEETAFIVIASPEFCFLQAAQELSGLELIRFGYELCSDYFYDETGKYGFSYSSPVTTPEKINTLLMRSGNISGIVKARQAIKYIHAHAKSPMEILLSMIVTLPISYGGFALKGSHLNGEAELTEAGKRIIGWNSCHCDLIWVDQKVVLEYDSDQVHLDSVQHARDKSRISALGASGYKVFTLTTLDMRNPERLENVLFALRKELGMRKEKDQFLKFKKKREELLSWARTQMKYDSKTDG